MGLRDRRPRWSALLFGCSLAAAAVLFARQSAAQNLSYDELKIGVLAHDAHFLGGKEPGADLNFEVLGHSPVDVDWVNAQPAWFRWALQPRPTVGLQINSAGATDQFYFGATWSWSLLDNVFRPGDGIAFSYFFGPGFNDGSIRSNRPDRKSLGSTILFREGFELGYRINPIYQISAYLDHISNGGLAKENQSINDVGVRFGFRF